MSPYDVCIVGFGPTGATAAILLADAGYRVAVIERLADVYDRPRAIALDHEIMRLFQQLDLIDEVLPHVAEYPASEYLGVDGDIIKRLDTAAPPYPQGWFPNYSFTQPPVEASLRRRAARAGATVFLGLELVAMTQDESGVTLDAAGPDGARTLIKARYVIGADGANSTVRRLSGLTLDDLDFDEPWLVVDVKVNEDAVATLPQVNVQYCEPAHPATYVVGPGNHRRWELMLDESEDPAEAIRPERVWARLARWVTPENATLWRSATYRFHALVASRWRAGRVFLAGDAAHQQPPFLGQGMCQGMRDAVNLSWKLDLVLRDAASETLLDTYGDERRHHVSQLISVIKTLGRFVCERDVQKARSRDQTLLAEMGGALVTTIRQDIMPRLDTGLLSVNGRLGRGGLFPQPRLTDGALIDDVVGCGFRVFVSADALPPSEGFRLGGADLSVTRIFAASTAPRLTDDLRTFVEIDDVVGAWFRERDAIAALVRPDNYVFGVAATIEEIGALVEECGRRLEQVAEPLATVP
ncbi:bifunctional 3-(3-hydroxy-phenyl)propionate/3-hydroxycinnamic acid hydroxylase [soil metagenome]